jgi:hypothetical protein
MLAIPWPTSSTFASLCLADSKSCSEGNSSLKNSLGGPSVPDLQGRWVWREAVELFLDPFSESIGYGGRHVVC